MINWPTPPSGKSNEASFMRRLVACCKASVPKAGVGMLYQETPSGIILSPVRQSTPLKSNSGGSTLQMFKAITIYGDYLVCRAWDGATLGGVDFLVSKPPNLRASLVEEVVDGITITYDWSVDNGSGNTRYATDGANFELQVCYPRYIKSEDCPPASNQDVVYAQKTVNKTGVEAVDSTGDFWLEIKPARVWARKYVQ